MSTTTPAQTMQTALRLLQVLGHALQLTDELEDIAYREAEISFVFAAKEVRRRVEEGYEILEKFIRINRTG